MTNQHRATPEQWDSVQMCYDREDNTIPYATATCLLELRARVEALEAAQRPSHPEFPDSSPASADSLVERVADAIYRNGTGDGFRDKARAAIREVAAWCREQHPSPGMAHVALRLEQEAARE